MSKKIKELNEGDNAVIGDKELSTTDVDGVYDIWEVPTPRHDRVDRRTVERKRASAVALVAKYDSLLAAMDKADDGIEEPVVP